MKSVQTHSQAKADLIKFSEKNENLFDSVIDLINYDNIEGQPLCDTDMLLQALQGSSPVDNYYWQKLKVLKHLCLLRNSKPSGGIAYGVRKDNTGVILWSHSREDSTVTDILISKALTALKNCKKIEAFSHASSLSMGLEGLPSNPILRFDT